MPEPGLSLRRCTPDRPLDELGAAIADAKGDDRLAPVTVTVSTNIAGVMARRALGRDRGLLGVDMVTLGRLAELIAGPELASQRRQPVSNPVLDLTITATLDERPGMFGSVADHPSTIVALREAHQELRLTGEQGVAALTTSRRGAEVVRISQAIERRL